MERILTRGSVSRVMLARAICVAICVAVSASVTGCSRIDDERLGIVSGAFAWARKDWPGAASAFIEAAVAADEAKDRTVYEYAIYGLAATYLAEDEYDAALSRLSSLGESERPEIRAGVWYQAGIIAYRRAQYADAAVFFRKSLENAPDSIDAKVNLELSRRSLEETSSSRSSRGTAFGEESGQSDETKTILDVVRKKEQDRWKNTAEETPGTVQSDY